MCVCVCVCVCVYNAGIWRVSANVLGFYIKPSSGQLLCNIAFTDWYMISFFQVKRKNEEAFKIPLMLMEFCDVTYVRN